ncbi:MAG: pilus assembly protein PilY, partial [Burkholderiaceae bacterium]|nr:pilus assembly protein PilY [Burkholderiaceae bacterium]
DYGGATGVMVFYGANDGMLHAVSGNKPDGNGRELWSFVAPEHYDVFKRLRENTPLINFPNVLATVNPLPRNWSVDGPITIYQGGGKVYIFAPMRRGGRFLYAFDVTIPASPILMWRKSNADIPELGQTWSEPRPATLKGYANPVLIMGAGYDAVAEDVDPPAATTMGRGVLVLDATTGALVKTFPTTRSVPGNVTLVDSNYDGAVDRAYAADMGGRIYRFDFEDSGGGKAVANWQSSMIANLADPTNPGGRKFFASPDVVLTRASGSLMIGSGDREKPLKAVTADRFYMVKDLLPGMPLPGGANYAATITEAELVPATTDAAALATAKGWYIALAANGEKVVNSPLTVAGTTFFATNRPTPLAVGSCDANLGEAKAYAVSFQSGTALLDRNGDGNVNANDAAMILTGGGLPPSPVSGIVDISGRQHLFLIGGGARGSAFEAEKPKVPILPTRRRIYWNVVRDK